MVRALKKDILIYVILIFIAIIMLVPSIYMISTSLKRSIDIYTYPPQWIPSVPILTNYLLAWDRIDFFRTFKNSLIVATSSTVVSILFNGMAGYALARKEFPGKNIVFTIIIGSMMVSLPIILIPLFLIIKKIGLYDTLLALILPWSASGYGIFLIRQYILTIPIEIEYAAEVDGCSQLGSFFKITFPLCKPILLTWGIFNFLWAWGDLMLPLIFIRSHRLKTVSLILAEVGGRYGGAQINISMMMAACALISIPPVVVFLIGSRQFLRALTEGAIKG